MDIYIMRHGHVERDFNEIMKTGEAGDPVLSMKGREQVEYQISLIAKEIKPNSLFFSPAKRARETAKIIFENLKIIPIRPSDIPELKDVGLPVGNNLRALLKLFLRGHIAWQEKWLQGWPPDFENTIDYITRIRKALEIIKEKDPIGPCLIVAHEETVWACRHIIEKIDFKQAILEEILNCEITKFRV